MPKQNIWGKQCLEHVPVVAEILLSTVSQILEAIPKTVSDTKLYTKLSLELAEIGGDNETTRGKLHRIP